MNKILFIDDDFDIRNTFARWLKKSGFEVFTAEDGKQGLTLFQKEQPDLIMTDVNMPNMSGLEMVKEIRKLPGSEWVPVVFLSAMTQDKDQEIGYQSGGDIYLCKPIHREQRPLVLAMLKAQIQRAQACRNKTRDCTTGLPTKEEFYQNLNHHLQNLTLGTESCVSMSILDIDFFKKVNDIHGHQIGDIILKEFSEVIKNNIREGDLPFRFGGEEFTLLLPNTNQEEALAVVERMLEVCRTYHFYNNIKVTFSAGLITTYNKTTSINKYFELCDKALYKAKETGRNQIQTTLMKEVV